MNNLGNSNRTGSNSSLLIIGSIFLLFLVYYTIMSLLAPGKKLNEIRSQLGSQEGPESKIDERLQSDSAYIWLLKKKAYLQARLSMAETDSVYLTINLADSTASLGISGVEVHSAKINSFAVSSILRSGNDYSIAAMFSVPMNIICDFATIRKEPLMIKMAPRDTSEFRPDVIPDTSDYEPVNYILEMDNGIRIMVYQDTDPLTRDKNHLFFFDLRYRLRDAWTSLKRTAMFKVPDYHPFIKIRLPKSDAKVLYRAIPRYGQIAVYI
jgi:hypothetical protein